MKLIYYNDADSSSSLMSALIFDRSLHSYENIFCVNSILILKVRTCMWNILNVTGNKAHLQVSNTIYVILSTHTNHITKYGYYKV